MDSYNLFRSKWPDGLVCAVPEARTVPRFLAEPHWAFEGRVDSMRGVPFGFDSKAAETGVRFNGYYLFSSFSRGSADRKAWRDCAP
ncbi:hypothetical protein [Microvirga flavescens]|uniref:hypothetical protein n=1 Tax=Microvirga flavescens TaxID=2249811 RepID=UPI000DDA6FB8|nr:hypothetical protein [Microvirga flavescens]